VNRQKISDSNNMIIDMDKGVEITMRIITKTDVARDKMKGIENREETKENR